MIIGIDVGGTHADGVLLQGTRIVKKDKVNVNQTNLQNAIISLLKGLLPDNKDSLREIHLSTTLCTNAIVQNNLEPVGMFIQPGPGVNPAFLSCGKQIFLMDGMIDHRGKSIKEPSLELIKKQAKQLQQENISSIGIATKFSHRNSSHELLAKQELNGSFEHISLGHQLSGIPNFPRRVYTTWLNSALMKTFSEFKSSLEASLRDLDIHCPCYVLKADGGTIPFLYACQYPCQSIHSGPSASVLGALALCDNIGDALLLDIGGTTTDIAIFSEGTPLLEPYGATVIGRPTLIRALRSTSIGIGGDSSVKFVDGVFIIGPEKVGEPMALGGSHPTPTDAMITLGTISAGAKSKAEEAMKMLCPELTASQTAEKLLHEFVSAIKIAADNMINEIFSRPVYTVSALLEREKIHPEQLIAIGGPAAALRQPLVNCFNLECIVPEDYEVANAVGAARARITVQASLYADSSTGSLTIPEASCMESISSSYSLAAAESRLALEISDMAKTMGLTTDAEIELIEKEEMNIVRGFSTAGKIISIKGQIRPGLSTTEETI